MADEDDTSNESPRFFDARQSIESQRETTHASETFRSAPQHAPDNPFSGEWLSNLIGELRLTVPFLPVNLGGFALEHSACRSLVES